MRRSLGCGSFRFARALLVVAKVAGLGVLASACAPSEASHEHGSGGGEPVAPASAAIAGVDGNPTISAANTVVNQYTRLAANAAQNATSITVTSVAALSAGSDALATGDLVMVVQMQGATINTALDNTTWGSVTAVNGAGLYELVEVSSVNAGTNTITLSCALKNAYSATGATQVIRVPQYGTLTIAAMGSVTAPAWDGNVGGVVAIHAASTVTLSGSINVTGLGFRGGAVDNQSTGTGTNTTTYAAVAATSGALKGEGIAGVRAEYGRGPAANGGGGGNAHNSGGGGGANGRAGGAWTGQGIFDLTVMGGASAWLLDSQYSATASEGGGRGGYSFSGNAGDALTTGPNMASWGGNNRRERGGLGGHPVDNDPANRIFFGGGGGAGDGDNGHAGRGGNGGGIVVLIAGSVGGAGQIFANGEAGVNAISTAGGAANGDSPGGGGGGGSVIVQAGTVTSFVVQATGGAGGNQLVNNGNECEGPGGGGGGGYVFSSGTLTANVAGALGGTSNCASMTEFPSNGATRGGAGRTVFGTPAALPYCVDTTAPDTMIDSGPDNPTNDPTGDFTFSSPDGSATFECSLDGGTFSACPSPFATAALADGSHTLAVRARDQIGNVDATPATRTWVVDTQAPDTIIDTAPTNPSGDTTGDFTFHSPDGSATFECSLDSAAFAPCTSALITGALSLGSHTFAVRALDAAGNVDATPDTHTWVVVMGDQDGDGLDDDDESAIGTDLLDSDSDDDGVPDGAEIDPGADSDGDGLINALDPDSDDDGLFDGTEQGLGCDDPGTDRDRGFCRPDADGGSTVTSPVNPDTDGGGVSDGSEDFDLDGEIDSGETDPTSGHGSDDAAVTDSDGDGLSDGTEATLRSDPNDDDSDDDGLADGDEPNPSADMDGDGLIDVLDVDSDDDGLFDGTETGRDCALPDTDTALGHCRADADPDSKTSAVDPDSDDGGVRDGSEDADLDGAFENGETDPTAGHGADDGTVTDSDGDGLSDGTEDTIGTDPNDADSDDDGVPDGEEPNPSDDHDGDDLPNALDPDSDGDGLFDGTETGRDCENPATDRSESHCIADGDQGDTTTLPLDPDTDHGGVSDGDEDEDHDGTVDAGERDPLDPRDDDDSNGAGGAGGESNGGENSGGTNSGGTNSGGTNGGGTNGGGTSGTNSGGQGGASGAGQGGSGNAGASASSGNGGNGGSAGAAAAAGGSAGSAGSSAGGASGATGTAGSSSGATSAEHVVVLGGGFCSFSFSRGSLRSDVAFFACAAVGLTWMRRRKRTKKAA